MTRGAQWLMVMLIAGATCACRTQPQQTHAPRPVDDGKQVVFVPAVSDAGAADSNFDAAAVATTPSTNKTPPPRVADVDFEVRKAPPVGIRCDGDLREWRPLVPDTKGAPSHVALSFFGGNLFVAGDIASSADGVWLELVFPHGGFPVPAQYDHGSGSMIPLDCDVVIPADDPSLMGGRTTFYRYKIGVVASAQSTCRRLMRKLDAMGVAYEAGFRKLIRVDNAGVRTLNDSRGLVPVANVSVGFAKRSNRLHFEVAIPDLALPRAAKTPVDSVEVGVFDAPVSLPPPSSGERRATLEVGEVRFEPGAAVRTFFFAEIPFGSSTPTIAYSYQPGEAATFEEAALCEEQGLPSVCQRRGVLSKPGGPALGAVQLNPGDLGNVLMVHGKPTPVLRGQVVSRPDGLHVLEEHVGFDDNGDAQYHAHWSVAIVDAQGQVREFKLPSLICGSGNPQTNCCHPASPNKRWCSPIAFHSADYTEVGIRGRGWQQDGSVVTELRWSWNATKGEYVSRTKPVAAGN